MPSAFQFPSNNLPIASTWTTLPLRITSFFNKSAEITHIFAIEAYATIRHILPASITWCFRKYILHEIKTITLRVTIGKETKVAYLNIHGKSPLIKTNKKIYPVLLVHGDYGHPFSMLKLADIAQKRGFTTFSLYLPGELNDQGYELHHDLLKKAVDQIEDYILSKNGIFRGILGAGHSSGGILLAERQSVDLDQRIKGTCAIAGRLNISDETECADGVLKSKIKAIYQGIVKHPELPLMQIVPKQDWNAPQKSMTVRPQTYCYSVPGMHLSGLYTKETQRYFTKFLNIFSTF